MRHETECRSGTHGTDEDRCAERRRESTYPSDGGLLEAPGLPRVGRGASGPGAGSAGLWEAEEWRDVVGAEGFYEVSSLGRVRSVDRQVVSRTGVARWFPGVLRTPYVRTERGGYPMYSLHVEGQYRVTPVHTLVAEAFIGPRPPGQVIRHLDGDPLNNVPANLAYGTVTENIHDTIRMGRNRNFSALRCKYGHLLSGANVRPLGREYPRYRTCVSCSRATAHLQSRGKTRKSAEFPALADDYYVKLMGVAA